MAAAVLENVNIVGIYKFVDSRGDLPNEGVSLVAEWKPLPGFPEATAVFFEGKQIAHIDAVSAKHLQCFRNNPDLLNGVELRISFKEACYNRFVPNAAILQVFACADDAQRVNELVNAHFAKVAFEREYRANRTICSICCVSPLPAHLV